MIKEVGKGNSGTSVMLKSAHIAEVSKFVWELWVVSVATATWFPLTIHLRLPPPQAFFRYSALFVEYQFAPFSSLFAHINYHFYAFIVY
ncbi:hypothetical protein GGR53DRAFT_488059 [Hypoxylon sp. FL1150]|nr:hypothetical protein GGR53DRAFT_488059 [Hypoxylon sp. FL1150]